MRSQHRNLPDSTRAPWVGLALCVAVALGWTWAQVAPNPDGPLAAAPSWLPLVAAVLAAAAIVPVDVSRPWQGPQHALRWTSLLLMVWAANGLPFDLLTAAGLIGHRTADGSFVMSTVYPPGLATRAAALTAAVLLARLVLARPAGPAASHAASWYGYAAFVLALPYPLLRIHWALGGTLGLDAPGAAGQGWEPLLLAIPWVLAAALSLLLVPPRSRIPRRLLLAAGWSATTIVAMIGPAALWSLVGGAATGETGEAGIARWVFVLFYGSWFLFAIAIAAATRSHQVRSAASPVAGSRQPRATDAGGGAARNATGVGV